MKNSNNNLDILCGKEISIVSISEYRKKKKEYFTTANNEDKVIKCFSPKGYHFWTKHRTIEEIGRLWYKHEPFLRSRLTESDCINRLQSNYSSGILGCSYRWLPGNTAACTEVVLQPEIISSENQIDRMINIALEDTMFGMFMDPFIYVEKLKTDYLDTHAPEYLDQKNYRVFIMEIDVDEYKKQEAKYIESIRTGVYNDGILCSVNYGGFNATTEFKEFLKRHTHFKV